MTPDGSKPIEQFEIGDEILSRPEDNPNASVRTQRIENIFELSADVVELRLGGQTIETTAEHPFYVAEKGWVRAEKLETGDLVVGHDDTQTAIESVTTTNRHETVYNVRVSEDHTYFVGDDDWGFSAWVHNAYSIRQAANGTWEILDGAGTVVKRGLTQKRAGILQSLFDRKAVEFGEGFSSGTLRLGDGVLHVDGAYFQKPFKDFYKSLREIAEQSGVSKVRFEAEFLDYTFRNQLMERGLNFNKIGDGPFGEIWEIIWDL